MFLSSALAQPSLPARAPSRQRRVRQGRARRGRYVMVALDFPAGGAEPPAAWPIVMSPQAAACATPMFAQMSRDAV